MSDENSGDRDLNDGRPTLVGRFEREHTTVRPRGGQVKRFATDEVTRGVFNEGLSAMAEAVSTNERNVGVAAAIGKLKIRSDATAKSHRHDALFSQLDVVGVEESGEVLALFTPERVKDLSTFVGRASPTTLKGMSGVGSITPFKPRVERGDRGSVLSMFRGELDNGDDLVDVGHGTLVTSVSNSRVTVLCEEPTLWIILDTWMRLRACRGLGP